MLKRWIAALLLVGAWIGVGMAPALASENDKEISETKTVAWLMPGDHGNYATWPQTLSSVDSCGDGWIQVDVYKYGTPDVKAETDRLIAKGTLEYSGEDGRVYLSHTFVKQTPCVVEPPVDPPVDPPAAPPADPVPAQPTLAG